MGKVGFSPRRLGLGSAQEVVDEFDSLIEFWRKNNPKLEPIDFEDKIYSSGNRIIGGTIFWGYRFFRTVPKKKLGGLKIGDELTVYEAWTKKYPKGRIVTIKKFYAKGKEVWIEAWWPGQDTDPELEMNEKLKQAGFEIDQPNHLLRGPIDKFFLTKLTA